MTLTYTEMTWKMFFIDELQETFEISISINILSYFSFNQQTDLDVCEAGVCVGNCRFEH